MKTYEFHYSIHEVDGKEVELIECTTWPRLDVQVIRTTPLDKTFILLHAGGEGNGELTQSNVKEILNGMKEIMNAAVRWWMKNKNNIK